MTLKTAVEAAENVALHHRNKLIFLIYQNIKQLFEVVIIIRIKPQSNL